MAGSEMVYESSHTFRTPGLSSFLPFGFFDEFLYGRYMFAAGMEQ